MGPALEKATTVKRELTVVSFSCSGKFVSSAGSSRCQLIEPADNAEAEAGFYCWKVLMR